MTNRRYVNLIGQTVAGCLEIYTILRYQANEPVWGARCLECMSTGVPIVHDDWRKGRAKCVSSLHGKEPVKPSSTAVAQIISRDDGWAEHYAQQLAPTVPSDQPQGPVTVPDPEKEKRDREYLEGVYKAAARAGVNLWKGHK
jgi:hypothetical protein